ncbi:MAG: methylmalonyl-CoA epimerase [Gaiellales bacterium]
MHPSSIHHIGHAVDDLDAAVEIYRRLLGASCEHREVVPAQGVEAASMVIGPDRVELLAPLGEDTPVGRFLERRGPGMHHVAYLVEDIRAALAAAAEEGAELIDSEPRIGLFGLQVAFIHPDSVAGVLVELVQPMNGS